MILSVYFCKIGKMQKIEFLFITSRQIELEGCATSQIAQNWIVISYLLKFFKQIAIITIEIDCFPRCPITYFLDSMSSKCLHEKQQYKVWRDSNQ